MVVVVMARARTGLVGTHSTTRFAGVTAARGTRAGLDECVAHRHPQFLAKRKWRTPPVVECVGGVRDLGHDVEATPSTTGTTVPRGRDGRYGRANLGGWLTPPVSVERDETLSDLSDFLKESSLRTDGPFTLRSGAVSSWYLDARRTTFDGKGATLVANAVLTVLDESVAAVGGMTMGADPIAVSTAVVGTGLGRTLRSFSIRKQPKDHGIGGRLVGAVDPGDRVAVLEDTTTTGGALLEAIDVAVAHGLDVVQVITLVDRSGARAASLMARRGVPYVALLRPADLGVDE